MRAHHGVPSNPPPQDRRRSFPRFYFLSNDDLLGILGHAREPAKVQPHLRQCFEALHFLDLAEPRKGGAQGPAPPIPPLACFVYIPNPPAPGRSCGTAALAAASTPPA